MTVNTKDVAVTLAYMIGVRYDLLMKYYGEEYCQLVTTLKEDKNATIIRYLNKIRTTLFCHFKDTEYEIRYNLKNLDRLPEWYDTENIRTLEKWGISILQVNYSAKKYMQDINQLLHDYIGNCQGLFEDWIKYEYIVDLFLIPKFAKESILKSECSKFMKNINYYPFQMYIHWNPVNTGNLLHNDAKLISFLYAAHKDHFVDKSKVQDATVETKENIYDFIKNAEKIVIAVDCENSDVFKLYGMLKNLDQQSLKHIEKIILYDDVHTSTAWEWLGKFTHIPVEHIEVERITDAKSLVDIRMTAGVCSAFYKDNVDSFILCSSDSDFWGLISSLPNANFLVMYEYASCGHSLKATMRLHNIKNCAIDDFYTGNTTELKKAVLFDKLNSLLPDIVGMNGEELTERIYYETRITATKDEMKNFYNKYIKTLQLRINDEGEFYIHICS